MKNHKVALITNIPTPYRISLFEKIAEQPSIDLHVFFTAASEIGRKWAVEMKDKFEYKILPGFTFVYQSWDSISYHINPSIIREFIRNNYDLVITGGYSLFTTQISFFLCKMKNIPFIMWSGSTVNESNIMRTVSLPFIKFMVRYTDAFIAYGTRAKEYLITLGAHPKKVFIAYNTVDTDFFLQQSIQLKEKKDDLKYKMGIKNKMVVLYVGQLIERKNIKTLIKAYSKLKEDLDASLVIVGDGPQKSELKNLCIEEKISDIYFVDFKQKEKLIEYYTISDLFVLPSTQEVWGLVLNEAMCCGLPVITTNKAGASMDLIENGINGYIVDAKNIEQLYQAMKMILINPELKESMGKKSQQIIKKKLTIEHAVKGFVSAINSCIKTMVTDKIK